MTRHRRAALAGAATLLALTALTALTAPVGAGAAAPAARPSSYAAGATGATSPGTIVFIRDHDVWIARADGSGARALTRDGTRAFPYGSPSQSDDGTVVATHVTDLVRMTQQGAVLNRIDPPSLPSSVGTRIDSAPLHAAISPDGRRIAYTLFRFFSSPSSGFRYATAYTAADRLTDPATLGTTFHRDPSWVGHGRTLQHGGFGSHVNQHDVGGSDRHWFGAGVGDFGDTTLSRDGRWLAGIHEDGPDRTLALMSVTGDATSGPPPTAPTPVCQVGPAAGITHPTFGPGHALAWAESDGIWTHPDVSRCGEVDSTLVLRDAAEPHWSPAPLSAAPAPTVRNTARPVITGRARVGTVLRATVGRWTPAATSYAVRWYRDGRAIAGATRTSYRLTRADRRRSIIVRVTARRAGHTPATATSRAVRVRR